MPEIKYSDNPNEETAFVETDDGQRNRAVLTAVVDGEIEFPANPNSTKVSVTVDGVKRKAIAVATIAGGGGDQHNLGYYATQSALEEAYPTAEAGDWAIVGATDTVWIWDDDNSEWVDSDQKGQVTSVNGQTGDVTLTASDIGALPTTGGTLTGDLTMQNSKVQLYNASILGSFWLESADSGYLRIGKSATASNDDLFINTGTVNQRSIAFGNSNGGRLGSASAKLEYVYTQKLSNGSDIAVPNVAGKMAIQVSSMPTAASTNEGEIYQFVGTTDSTYTHGYLYECKAQGTTPDETYAWEAVEVQASSGGLPTQTGNAGKFLTTDGTDASWSDKPLVNTATGSNAIGIIGSAQAQESVCIGANAQAYNLNGGIGEIAIGNQAKSNANGNVAIGQYSNSGNGKSAIAIGNYASVANGKHGAIQLGWGTNNNAGTMCVALSTSGATAGSYTNYELLSADGTIPEARLADTTNAQQGDVLTLDSTGNAVWQAGGGGTSSISITLPANGWDSLLNIQRINVAGVTSSSTVIVGAAPNSLAEYTSCGVYCSGQGSGWLSFTCATTPSNDLTVTVLIF